ncbi:hypothetical protein O181_101664 [Austropuccinia psidii MF-1]|uniref:Uncharacterized protein n=1 Tax=Austropuccinia psidii MF-1 TaxID=1389203 RepID=A0A9Q3PHI5_9BASI|nr:hypothetical protein [Austropuccinia psidii MF-1]
MIVLLSEKKIFSHLEKRKNAPARTSSEASIHAESSDDKNNHPPQTSFQDMSVKAQHNNKHPPPKVASWKHAPTVALPSSKSSYEKKGFGGI